MRNKNMGLIIEGLNEAKEKEFLSDLKKGEEVYVFGRKCKYIITIAGKKKYKLEAVNPTDRDPVDIEYLNGSASKKRVELSKDGKTYTVFDM